VTDGEDHEGTAIDLAERASSQGMIIHTVGVGTETGSLIPLIEKNGSREYKRDRQGILVTSVLNESLLRDIARAGDGVFVRFDNRAASHREIMRAIDTMEKRTIQSHVYAEFEDRYQPCVCWIWRSISNICILIVSFSGCEYDLTHT